MDKRYMKLSNGKKLSYQIYGSGEKTVILFHGLLGSAILDKQTIMQIEKSNISLIVIERPGYGDTDCIQMDRVLDWTPMFKEILDELKLDKVDVVGISAGAPYAYASAYGFKDNVDKVWILGGVPAVFLPSVIKHYPKESIEAYEWLRVSEYEPIQSYYKNIINNIEDDPTLELDNLYYAVQDSSKNDCYGMARESKLQIKPWGFDISEINQEIILYHSPNDSMIPFEAVKEMNGLLLRSKIIVHEEIYDTDKVHQRSTQAGLSKVLQHYGGEYAL